MSYNNPSDQENYFEQSVLFLKPSNNNDKNWNDNTKLSTKEADRNFTTYGAIPLTEQNVQIKNIRDRAIIQKQAHPPLSSIHHNEVGRIANLKANMSVDDFAETNSVADFKPPTVPNKAIRSGRQRKKTAARSKGGEFQAKRKKRRIYFCSIGSEIDVEGIADRFLSDSYLGLRGKMYAEVLHLYVDNISIREYSAIQDLAKKDDYEPRSLPDESLLENTESNPTLWKKLDDEKIKSETVVTNPLFSASKGSYSRSSELSEALSDQQKQLENVQQHTLFTISESPAAIEEEDPTFPSPARLGKPERSASDPGIVYFPRPNIDPLPRDHSYDREEPTVGLPLLHEEQTGIAALPHAPTHRPSITYHANDIAEDEIVADTHYWQNGGREVFIFDFGAIVFWGYHRDEVSDLLDYFRSFVLKGLLSEEEFKAGEDDMAFVLSSEAQAVTIANDVITLPEITSVKSRLAVSFAIAQSTILAIFEARIEEKVEDYKYIPETLALRGKIQLSAKELGNMIGEVFVIRHDVNLHNEILNIPDYFWKEYSVEPLYRMTSMYLEMEPRTEVLNKRLDLLRELLKLLQHQHENSHAVKLEWIVIWLIVMSVVLELFVMVGKLLKLWD